MTTKPKFLIVLSSHDKMDDGTPTGWYLPELAHPLYKLSDRLTIVVASPSGGEAPLNPGSLEAWKNDPESARLANEDAALWKNTHKLSDFVGKTDDFAGIFVVGGHGRKSRRP
jgi:putative intracellular protease/amidase